MEAMGATEAAVITALLSSGSLQHQTAAHVAQQQHMARISKPVHEALSLSGFSGKKWEQQHSGMAL